MVIETQQLPFLEWLQSGPLIWLVVVGTLALAGLVLGYLVAAVRNGPVAALRDHRPGARLRRGRPGAACLRGAFGP